MLRGININEPYRGSCAEFAPYRRGTLLVASSAIIYSKYCRNCYRYFLRFTDRPRLLGLAETRERVAVNTLILVDVLVC